MRPTQKQLESGAYKLIDGIWHKRCRGPAHDEEAWLPATQKYFYFAQGGKRKGQPLSRCRLCKNWHLLKSPGSHRGWVEVSTVHPFYTEAVNRIGAAELRRRTGLSYQHINGVLTKKLRYVKKAQLRRLMLELVSIQRKNEYSIPDNSRWRAERRNNAGLDICIGCGTPRSNYTKGCQTCRNRLYDEYRRKKSMTKAQYDKLRIELSTSEHDNKGLTIIMGRVVKA